MTQNIHKMYKKEKKKKKILLHSHPYNESRSILLLVHISLYFYFGMEDSFLLSFYFFDLLRLKILLFSNG